MATKPQKGASLMVKGIIFDLDGLMFDTEPVWIAAWDVAFQEQGLSFRRELLPQFFGASHEAIGKIVGKAYAGDVRALAAVHEHARIGREMMLEKGAAKKPRLDELLAFAKDQGIRCAVASASPKELISAHLDHGGIEGYFSAIAAGDDGLPSKPAPDVFLEAARRLGTEPAATAVLEDSALGIDAASAGGFIPVMVPDMVEPTEETRDKARFVCRSLHEVQELLAEGRL